MDDDLKECPNCGAKLNPTFTTNMLVDASYVRVINRANGSNITHACMKCNEPAYSRAVEKLSGEVRRLRKEVTRLAPCIPIVTTHNPQDWTYRTISIVTAQTVTGTGFFSEFTSAFTDAFGAQSKAFTGKLQSAEEMCKLSLRLKTVRAGGNAVLATDIDYGEVGGAKAMLMVCMSGTAVHANEQGISGDGLADDRQKIKTLVAQLNELETFVSGAQS